jgi:hypothetical protein
MSEESKRQVTNELHATQQAKSKNKQKSSSDESNDLIDSESDKIQTSRPSRMRQAYKPTDTVLSGVSSDQ